MIWVDYCLLAVALLSVVVGALRGFTRELFSLLTWILAIGLCLMFGRPAADALQGWISIPALRVVAGYAGCLLGGLLLGALASLLFVEMVRNSRLVAADRTLGAGFGLLRALLVIALLVMIADNMGAQSQNWRQRSLVINKMQWVSKGFEMLVPESWLQAIRPQPDSSAPDAEQPQER